MEEAGFLLTEVVILGCEVDATCFLLGHTEGHSLCFFVIDAVFFAVAAVPDRKVELVELVDGFAHP